MSYEMFEQRPRDPLGLLKKTTPLGTIKPGETIRYQLTPDTKVTIGLNNDGVLDIKVDGKAVKATFGPELDKPGVEFVLDSAAPEITTARADVLISPVEGRERLVFRGERKIPLFVTPEEALALVAQAMTHTHNRNNF